MKTLREIVDYMVEPGDEKKPWLRTAIISHCMRLARVYKVKAERGEIASLGERADQGDR